jgi:hypothetical protein
MLVESFDLHPSNQYSLMRVIPSCFRFAKMCLCQVSLLSKCSPVLDILGELHVVHMDWGACFSSWIDLNSLAFIFQF